MRKYPSLMVVVLSAKQWRLWFSPSDDLIWFEYQLSDWHICKTLVRILVRNADNKPQVLTMITESMYFWKEAAWLLLSDIDSFVVTDGDTIWQEALAKRSRTPRTSGANHNSFLICYYSTARDFEWFLAGMNWLNQKIYPLPAPSFIFFHRVLFNVPKLSITFVKGKNSKPLNSLMASLQSLRPFLSFYLSFLFIPIYTSVLPISW